jgi:hypothetical protein
MATACWAFIVAKSTLPEAAYFLVFRSLQGTNMRNSYTAYQQAWSTLARDEFVGQSSRIEAKPAVFRSNSNRPGDQLPRFRLEVTKH